VARGQLSANWKRQHGALCWGMPRAGFEKAARAIEGFRAGRHPMSSFRAVLLPPGEGWRRVLNPDLPPRRKL
jgi:hypothetical protein